MSIVLRNGKLIDGTGKVQSDATVVIDGATISAVGEMAQMEIPPGKHQIIDVAGMTIMPGMMDLHDHLHGDASGIPDGAAHDRFGEMIHLIEDRDAYQAVLHAENARKALAAGFTTIRDTGSPRDITIDIARAERDGILIAPRIFYCATIDMTYPVGKKQVHGVVGGNITGPVEAVRAVREKVGLGADWIHMNATGAGAGMYGPEVELLTLEEMEAAAKTAHNFGLRVTCNACGAVGMKNAILAGVDCIEHGTHIANDDEVIQMMVDREVGWVPTLWVSLAKKWDAEAKQAQGLKSTVPDYWLQRELELIDLWRRGFEKALKAGVLTAIGTDCGAPFVVHGKNATELEIFVRYGMTEMQAIEAATRVAAQVMGMEDRLGTIEAGKEADVIVVNGDPLKNIRVLQDNGNIALVLKAGQIMRQTRDVSRNGGLI
ncbi:MAG: amidohydrolase family protein [Chloroflexi bacterium]|nr:amidohydrolase family protein [Chloroflexota bacterium]